MAITIKTPDLVKLINAYAQIMQEELLKSFQERGERLISYIRNRPEESSWFNHTQNLRSSIGYGIYSSGKLQIESAFEVLGNGYEGSTEGKKIVSELAQKYSDVYALVIVAGMDYASYVEAHENKDVLASAKLQAMKMAESDINKAIAKAYVRMNNLKL